jgi:hypothetical protein
MSGLYTIVLFHIGAHRALAIEQQLFELSTASEQEHTVTSVLMQSVILPCKAILLIMEPERVRMKRKESVLFIHDDFHRSCGIK